MFGLTRRSFYGLLFIVGGIAQAIWGAMVAVSALEQGRSIVYVMSVDLMLIGVLLWRIGNRGRGDALDEVPWWLKAGLTALGVVTLRTLWLGFNQ